MLYLRKKSIFMQRTFKSKIGILTHILLLITIILLFYSMWIKSIIFLVFMLIINVLFVPSFIHTEYIFNNNMLYIKSGYLPVIKIKLDIISEIISHPKKNSLFTTNHTKRYALSSDQIILYCKDNRRIAISPYDKEGFIRETIKCNPDIKITK